MSLRYKLPDEDEARLASHPVLLNTLSLDRSSANFRFSAAVAGFGMLLRESGYNKDLDFDKVLALAKGAMREDEERKEFLTLAKGSGSWEERNKEGQLPAKTKASAIPNIFHH